MKQHLGLAGIALLAASSALGAGDAHPPAPLAICSSPVWSADGDQLDCRYGTVAPAGDVNGDGYADGLVGSYNYDDPEADEGSAFVYLGGPSGMSTTRAWTFGPNQPGAGLGDKLSTAGDVNGDGYDDVINGAGDYDDQFFDEGRAYLHLGSPTGLQQQPAWTADGNQESAHFSGCVQAAGDVNGDGFDDVIVGAWLYDHGQQDEGAAWVYLGSDTGLADAAVWMGESNSTGAIYGYFCSRAGDVNGDGFEDIVVGARRFSGNGITKEGRVYVYHGSPSGPSLTPNWTLDGGQSNSELGTSPAPAGDVNGDGYDDLIVNAPRYNGPNVDEGRVWLYLGSPSGLRLTPDWMAEGNQDSAQFGYHVDGAGDADGDGYDDVVVSAPWYDANGIESSGAIFLYRGSASGLSPTPAWTFAGDQIHGELGHAVRFVGDVNRDGRDDVMAGAIYRDSPQMNSGRAYLFYGCPEGLTGVDGQPAGAVRLSAGPNPFVGSTQLAIELRQQGRVRLGVFDLSGRCVATLVDGQWTAGRHVVVWSGLAADGRRAPAGVYHARLEAPGSPPATLKLVRMP